MKMKKLLKNAVVYAVAASMLFATPLTASAGLIDAYKVTDGSGHDAPGSDENEPTGTVTNTFTDTNTTVLTENAAKIIGISLDQEEINTAEGEHAQLRASVLFESDVDAKVLKWADKFIRWEIITDEDHKLGIDTMGIDVSAEDRTVATLTPRKGTKPSEYVVIRASIGNPKGTLGYDDVNDYDFTYQEEGKDPVKIEGFDTYYYAEAKVSVKWYSKTLDFSSDVKKDQYVKHTLDLSDKLVRDKEDKNAHNSNDSITWSTSDAKVATVSAAGLVTFKKAGTVKITAVGEKGAKAEKEFTVTAGIKATRVEIQKVTVKEGESALFTKNKTDTDFANDDPSIKVKAVMYGKAADNLDGKNKELVDGEEYPYVLDEDGVTQKKQPFKITDVITWTSNKTNILTVVDNKDGTVTLTPQAAGTAKVTAKASNGKSASLTVTVNATLTGIEINKISADPLYSGQTAQLSVTRKSGKYDVTTKSTEGLKWSVVKVDGGTKANPNASINAKGLLTIKTKLNNGYKTVTVQVEAKKSKDKDNNPIKSKEYTINIAQSSIDAITVLEDGKTPIARIDTVGNEAKITGKKSNIYVPKDRTYTVKLDAAAAKLGLESSLTLKSSNAKVATIAYDNKGTATIKAVGKGTATITVSGIQVTKYDTTDPTQAKNVKTIKTTFKVNAIQPITSLTINKPSVVVKATGKTQNIAFKVTKNKNAAGKVTWTIANKNGTQCVATINASNGKVQLKNTSGYKAGDEYVVTATADSGVKAKATIKVVTTSADVSINQTSTLKDGVVETWSYVKPGKTAPVKNALQLEVGKSQTLYPFVNLGTKTAPKWVAAGETTKDGVAAGVTYTVNKKGIVSIIDNKVYRVKSGSVTVTVKTEDGKSYKLKIDDK